MSYPIVYGKFTLKVDCDGGEMAEIYKAIGNAPAINDRNGPIVFTIRPLSRHPLTLKYRKSYFHRCYAAEISFNCKMEGSNFSEICEDVEHFIEYLAHLEKMNTLGKIKVIQRKTAERDGTLCDEVNSKIYNINF